MMLERERLETLYEKRVTVYLGELFTIALNRKEKPSKPISIEIDTNLENIVEIYVTKGKYLKLSTEVDPMNGLVTIFVESEIKSEKDVIVIVPENAVILNL